MLVAAAFSPVKCPMVKLLSILKKILLRFR
jgi:hypothetical protein